MLELEVLVGKLVSIDALSTRTIALREVSALDHELLDHAVECGALITVAFRTCGQSTKVLGGLEA